MKKIISAAVILAVGVGCRPLTDDPALLVVGYHDGQRSDERRDRDIERTDAEVVVGEMDQVVDLVLLSQKPITWRVTVPSGARLDRLMLGGPGATRSKVVVNGELQLDEVVHLPIVGAYLPAGYGIQEVLRKLPPMVGATQVDGFVGGYRPVEDETVIEVGSGGPDFLSGDPLAGKTVRLPGLENLTFNAPINYRPGIYNAYGEAAGPSTAIASELRVHAPDQNIYYEIYRGGTVQVVDETTGEVIRRLDPPETKIDGRTRYDFSPVALDYDPENEILYIASNGIEGRILAYNTSSETWATYALVADMEIFDIAWDSERERVTVLYDSVLDQIAMTAIYPNRAKLVIFEEPRERFAGIADFIDPRMSTKPSPRILAVSDDWSLLGMAEHHFSREMAGYDYSPRRIWAVSSGGDTVELTYYN